jgi:hypothetical protein
MKHIRRVDHPAEEHSSDMDANEKTHAANNKSDVVRLKVFIADDSVAIRNRLKEMLRENKSIDLT